MDKYQIDCLLVELIKKFACLYDRRSFDFKNQVKRQNAWTAIGTTLGITGDEAEARFKVLRERFVKERKEKERGTKLGEWPMYKKMDFLNEHIAHRRSRERSGMTHVSSITSLTEVTLEEPPMKEEPYSPTHSASYLNGCHSSSLVDLVPTEADSTPRDPVNPYIYYANKRAYGEVDERVHKKANMASSPMEQSSSSISDEVAKKEKEVSKFHPFLIYANDKIEEILSKTPSEVRRLQTQRKILSYLDDLLEDLLTES